MKFTAPLLLLALPFTVFANGNSVTDLTTDLTKISDTFTQLATDARALTLSLTGATAAQRILTTSLGFIATYTKTLTDVKGLTCPVSEDDGATLASAVTKLTDVLIDAYAIDKSSLFKGWGLGGMARRSIRFTQDNVVQVYDAIEACVPDSVKPSISNDKDRFVKQADVTAQIYS